MTQHNDTFLDEQIWMLVFACAAALLNWKYLLVGYEKHVSMYVFTFTITHLLQGHLVTYFCV